MFAVGFAGLLGVAGLQSRMQVAEVEAYQRTQAIVLLQDMVDRINANRVNAASYATGSVTLGTGTTGSRMASGNYRGHRELEEAIAHAYRWPAAIVFSTGYQANLGTLSALAGAGEYLLVDADSHASIYDGCKLSGAEVIRFRHNDAAHLEELLAAEDPAVPKLIAFESVYSMDGDICDLPAYIALKKKYGCLLMVDEAHATGVLGTEGCGLVKDLGLEKVCRFFQRDRIEFHSIFDPEEGMRRDDLKRCVRGAIFAGRCVLDHEKFVAVADVACARRGHGRC